MSTDRLRHVLRDDERGFAVMASIMVISVLMVLTMAVLANGLHLVESTARDRSWNTALQVAEAGIDRAVYELTKSSTYTGTGTGVMAVPGGEVEIAVQEPTAGYITVFATGYAPSRSAATMVKRRLRAEFAPADTFSFAMFSETGLFVKNNGEIVGDVFANEGVLIENNANVYGDVISATEGVRISSNAKVWKTDGDGGDLYSGGPAGIVLDSGAIAQGDAYAQATACSGSPAPSGQYGISNTGLIGGRGIAYGSISGNVPAGGSTPNNCQLAQATRTLPSFTWDASLYEGETEYTTITAFDTYYQANKNNMSGVHRVWVDNCGSDPSGASSLLAMDAVTIIDDFTLVTNCRIDFNNNVTVSAPSEALVTIVVLNPSSSPAAVNIKNNFTVENDPAVLLFSDGLIEIKNNPDHNGAVYAGAISVKNNLDVTYDDRVERTLGFGDVKYDRQSWVECRADSTGSTC